MDEIEKWAGQAMKRAKYQAWLTEFVYKPLTDLGYELLRETGRYICFETKDQLTRIFIYKRPHIYDDGKEKTVRKTVLIREWGKETIGDLTWAEIIAVAEILKELTEKELSADVADNE